MIQYYIDCVHSKSPRMEIRKNLLLISIVEHQTFQGFAFDSYCGKSFNSFLFFFGCFLVVEKFLGNFI
jgi:hypothetical protein